MPQNQMLILVFAVFFIIFAVFLLLFGRLFSIWLRAFLSGAGVSFPELLLMRFRRSPVQQIVDSKIMAAQAGIPIPTSKLEAAVFAGADIERAVRALVRAKETGVEVTWEEVIAHDMSDQLKRDLFPDQS